MNEVIETPARAWYRHPLVWMIIAIPGSAVLVGIAMLVLAAASYDGLVVDDYYKRGLEINRDLERDRAAATLGLSAGVVYDANNQTVRVEVVSANPRPLLPERLTLRLVHPTRSGLDRVVELRPAGNGTYLGKLSGLEAGRWHLQLETASWRIVGRMPVPGTGLSDLSPAA